MASIKASGLSDAQISALLNEIEDEEEDINRDVEMLAGAKKEGSTDISPLNSEEAARKRAEKQRETRLKKQQIQRDALAQTNLPLSDSLPYSDIKLLISLLTKKFTTKMERYKAYIDERLYYWLIPHIPGVIRKCLRLYPDAMRPHPGFLIRIPDEYGGGSYWANPKIPCYLEQGTEQQFLLDKNPKSLRSVYKAIAVYRDLLALRTNKEVKIASSLSNGNVRTYFDLLKKNPMWFDTLYQHKFGEKDERGSKT